MKQITTSILIAAALLVGAPSSSSAVAQDGTSGTWRAGSFPPECVKRDLQLVTQLEQYGESQSMRPEIANEAFWTMMQARQACYDARVAEGLAIYDTIQTLTLAQRPQ